MVRERDNLLPYTKHLRQGGSDVADPFEEKVRLSESPQHEGRDPSFAEEMVFDSNLQEFAARVGLIVSLELGEKISSEEAYARIKTLWKQLKASKKNLRIGDGSSAGPRDEL